MRRNTAPVLHKPTVEPLIVLAPDPHRGDNRVPITESERLLFAACFGKLIDQIFAESD
jgi:hypothetical protein